MNSALRVLEKEGLDAVTMRRVAHDLDTGAGSLYAYVQNKAELHELLLDEVFATVEIPEPDPAQWKEQLLDLLIDTAQAMAAKPGIARVALETAIPTTPRALQLIDGVLGLLHTGGVPSRAGLMAADILALHMTAAAYEMSLHGRPAEAAKEFERRTSQIGEYLKIIPPDRLPHLRTAQDEFGTDEESLPDALRVGLAMLLDGLIARTQDE